VIALLIVTHSGGRIFTCFHLRVYTDANVTKLARGFVCPSPNKVLCAKIRLRLNVFFDSKFRGGMPAVILFNIETGFQDSEGR
jgi:hypothetical protein